VSLILEALKKVERERATPEQRGFLVLGPAAWAPSRSNLAWVFGMVAAAAVAGGAVYVLTRPDQRAEGPAEAPVVTTPSVPVAGTSVRPAPVSTVTRPRAAADAPAPPRATTAADRTPPGPVLVLHAISQQDGTPIAVVNERVVREGDTFDGVRVLRIGAAEVEVEVAGARRTLRF
jgi:hypothetical protein